MNSDSKYPKNHESPLGIGPAAVLIMTVWTGVFYLCFFLFPFVSFPGEVIAVVVSGLVCSLSAFGALAFLIGKQISRPRLVFILILCVCADIGINLAVQHFQPAHREMTHVYAGINLTLMGIAFCGGLLMSDMIKKPSYIMPLAAAAGLADIWSVSSGVTHTIIQSRAAMNFFLFSFPVAGKGILPIIGVADFAFAAMFLSLSYKFDIPAARTRLLLAASFVLSMGLAVVMGGGAPVLPVMGGLFVIGNYAHIKITDPREKKEAALGLLIIMVALAAVTLIKGAG